MSDYPEGMACLVVAVGSKLYAFALADVVETMPALPLETVAGSWPALEGLSIVRGVPVPVISLATLVGEAGKGPNRWVIVRAGHRNAALAVDAVVGIRSFPAGQLEQMAGILREPGALESVAALDGALLFALPSARIVPPEVWASLEPA